MANRKDYYFRQRVTEAELDVGFADLEDAAHNLAADLGFVGVLANAVVSQHAPVPDLTVDVSGPGSILDQLGQRIFFSALQNVNVAQDDNGVSTAVATAGNEKVVSVFAKFDRALSDPRVDGNSITVFFRRDESFRFIVAQGVEAPAGTAAPPPLRSDAILLADVTRSYGQTQVLAAAISTARRQDAFVVTGSPRSIRRGQTRESISDTLGFYNAHASATADRHNATGVDALATTGSPNALTAGTAKSQIDALLGFINGHQSQASGAHAASAISYAGGGAWADAATNPATTVEAQLDKVITDLAATSGAPKVGAAATSGTPSSLTAGSVKSQLDALLGFINGHVSAASGAHAASAISYAGGGNWADATTNPATTVEAQLDKVITDLAATSGAPKVGTAATAGTPNSLTAGSVKSQLDALLGFINGHAAATSGAHAATAVSYAGSGNWKDATTVSGTTVEAAIDEVVSDLAADAGAARIGIAARSTWLGGRTNPASVSIFDAIEKIITDLAVQTASDDGAERVGAQAVTGSPNSLAAGSIRSQLDVLLGLVNQAALVGQANTWTQPQTFSGSPGVQYPSTAAMRLLLYVPSSTAPLRVYADDSNIWITLNAQWMGTQWQADQGGNFRSALRLYRTTFFIYHQSTDPDTWTSWQYGLQLDLSATNKEFVDVGTSGLRQRAYTGQEGYCSGSSGAGGSWNYPFRFGTTPSTVTFAQASKNPATWSTEPTLWMHDVMGGSWFGYPGAAGTFWYDAVVTAY